MAAKMLALAAASVAILVYMVGRGDAPAVQCTDPARSDCIAVAQGVATGPGTYRLPYSRFVFDLPAGTSVRVSGVLTSHGGITRETLGLPVPLRDRRLPVREPLSGSVGIGALAQSGTADLYIDLRTGKAAYRAIVTEDNPMETIYQYPQVRFVLDRTTWETTERYPLDRVSILPAVEVLFARTEADLLFDRILASIRPVTPPDGRYH